MKWCRFFLVLYVMYIFFVLDGYYFLVLNISLAYIPFELAALVYQKERKPYVFWPIAFVWLLFFPNSPYLLTDFFHLENLHINAAEVGVFSNNPYIWERFTVMTVGVCFGLYTGFVSLKWMLDEWLIRFKTTNNVFYWATFVCISVLSGYAIYLGRFARLHSVHLFTDPLHSIQQMLAVFSYQMVYFIACFMVIQTLVYLIFLKFPDKKD
ncbi:DUF1361 domain-containing protein [Paenilisteria rocourtiae]|uniref:Putative membrane protein n=1 Tax=Listeria rocourtiae TaxID=647910 RepID=A0A4R6ZNA2_9LIST|nr:DUF1361 domain-containing protein [Listeria rocourtiae]EUJ51061.1 hypothetical protein PROCOU_03094 [Listeria rocourtiae FSL F6-920]MBC1603597.1 DUF1361 domain-containing protein [Listeria rocourtiae]TDR53953.1 putative membrane protein [Listeria rocourtiae]